MLQAFTKRCTDESTEEEFVFTFYCDLCDRAWKSVPIPFTSKKGGGIWERLFELRSSLWKAEHNDAFERANREGMFYFNRCIVCKKWVCDADFSEEENKCWECSQNQ